MVVFFSENRLLTFDRYIEWNNPVSIKISNFNLPVFLPCEIKIDLLYVKINKTRLISVLIKLLLLVKQDCSMQSVKQHDNL